MTLIADNMTLGGSINGHLGRVTIEANDRAQEIRIGAGATDAAGVLAIDDQELLKIHGSGGLTIGRGDQTGAVTVAGAADAANLTGGTLTLQSGTGNIAVNARLTSPVDAEIQTAGGNIGFGSAGAISAAGKSVTLSAAGGSVEGDAASLTNVTASTLDVVASSGIGATNALETSVGTLMFGNTTNGVQVTNSKDTGVTVSGTNAGTGLVKITETAGDITIGASDVTTAGGAIVLRTSGADKAIASVTGSDIASGGGAVTLMTDNLGLGGTISAGSGLVTIRPNDAAQQIQIGAGATDSTTALAIDGSELSNIYGTGGLTIGGGARRVRSR